MRPGTHDHRTVLVPRDPHEAPPAPPSHWRTRTETGTLRVQAQGTGRSPRLVLPHALAPGRDRRVTADLRMEPARSGQELVALELWTDGGPRDGAPAGYGCRLLVRNGVQYVQLLRRAGDREAVLFDRNTAVPLSATFTLVLERRAGRLRVLLDGRQVLEAGDPHPLDGPCLTLVATDTDADVTHLDVEDLGPSPEPRPAPDARPLRARTPRLRPRPVAVLDGTTSEGPYRHTFWAADLTGDDGPGVAYVCAAQPWDGVTPPPATASGALLADALGEQWLVLRGDLGSRSHLYGTTAVEAALFTELRQEDGALVLTARGEEWTLRVRWTAGPQGPLAEATLHVEATDHWVVVWQAGAGVRHEDVAEVLCGPLQHGRMVRGPEATGAWEMTTPLAAVEHRDGRIRTTGLYVPAAEIVHEHEQARGEDAQRYAMSLRDEDDLVRPVHFAPQYGGHALLEAGSSRTTRTGLLLSGRSLDAAWERLLREEYGYRAYRSNVFDTSMTATVHHLIDLLDSGPGRDEDGEAPDLDDFHPSPSGWWSRAKGFVDIENQDAVRTTTAGVLLSAVYLTDDTDLYRRRALPTVEYHLSRNSYGWSPVPGTPVYGRRGNDRLGAVPFDNATLGPLHALLRGTVDACGDLARRHGPDGGDYWLQRPAMAGPLAAWRHTGDPADLEQALTHARTHIREHVDGPYDHGVDPHDFAYYYSGSWTELLELYEDTGAPDLLAAAHREARRFATQLFVRPVPEGTVRVQDGDVPLYVHDWWKPSALFPYPCDDLKPEEVPAWQVSVTGMGMEAVNTYRGGGPVLNPAWAPFLLRLAGHTGDTLLADVARNAVVGRFTNYPGYYYKQHSVAHARPDFPHTGPTGATMIYHHHAPAQLGLALDWLFTDHEQRSGGAVRFPAEFESCFVWFKYRVRGHAPGVFHGTEGAWPWLPRGLVHLEDPQVDWIAAHSTQPDGDTFHLALADAAPSGAAAPSGGPGAGREVTVRLEPSRLGLPATGSRPVTLHHPDGTHTRAELTDGTITVTLPAGGTAALSVPGLPPLRVATHRAPTHRGTWHEETLPEAGLVRGVAVPRPDGDGWDAHVQVAGHTPARLDWRTGDGPWHSADAPRTPREWTVHVPDPATPLTYRVAVGEEGRTVSGEAVLRLEPLAGVTGPADPS